MKLQKLLYYAQGHHLATFNQPLFHDAIHAWDMGPVVPSVWKEEREGSDPWPAGTVAPKLGEAELNTIGYVLSRYGNLSGKDLENLSHSEDPWRDANARRLPGGSVCIEQEAIREFFAAAEDAGDDDGIRLDSDEVRDILAGSEERLKMMLREDNLDELRAMLAAARGQ